jgi:hypothetical protein
MEPEVKKPEACSYDSTLFFSLRIGCVNNTNGVMMHDHIGNIAYNLSGITTEQSEKLRVDIYGLITSLAGEVMNSGFLAGTEEE